MVTEEFGNSIISEDSMIDEIPYVGIDLSDPILISELVRELGLDGDLADFLHIGRE